MLSENEARVKSNVIVESNATGLSSYKTFIRHSQYKLPLSQTWVASLRRLRGRF